MTIANHSDLLKLDLQFFSEDMILPDDFEMPSDAVDTLETEEPVESVEDTTETEQTEEVEQPQEELTEAQKAFLKVKYNKEELELDEEKARELAQKGLNYDKLQERLTQLETDPRLTFVEELAQEQGLDVNEYLQQVKEWREQEKLNQLIQSNIPEDMAREIMENRKFREQFEAKQKEDQAKQQRDKELQDFIETYPDVKPDTIPQEVWDAYANGTPLKFAYMQHDYNQMKNQIKILKQNEQNVRKAPVGGTSIHGSTDNSSKDPFEIGFDSI